MAENEIRPRDRVCVVFADRVHRAQVTTIMRRRWNPETHDWAGPARDLIVFRTVQDDEVGTVAVADCGLKWNVGWDAETTTALLAANALAELPEPTVQLNSHTGRPTWVL